MKLRLESATALVEAGAFSLLLLCLLLYTAAAGHCAAEGEIPAVPRKLVAAIPEDFPPTYFLDKDGNPVGFAVEVMNELARRTGLTVEYVNGKAWDDLIQMVLTGKADLIPGLTIDEGRKELLAFTDPVEFLPVNLIVASENHTVQGISPGLTIGVMKGSAADNLLMKDQTIRLKTFSNPQTMLFELLAGRVDGIVLLTQILMKQAADVGVDDKVKVVGKPVIEAKRSIALRKGDPELLAHLNKAIGAFIGSPEYRQIYVKWYGKPKPYWTAGRISAVSGVLLVLIVCGMAFWRYRSIVRLNNRLMRSIAEHKQAEDALRGSERKYRSLASASDSMYLVDRDCRFLLVNERHLARFGLPIDQVIGRKHKEFHSAEEAVKFENIIKQVFETGESLQDEYRSPRDGRYFVRTLSPVKDDQGMTSSVTVVAKDITDRKRAEEEKRNLEERLHRAEKMEALGTLAGGVAHDLNNVLGIVVGYAEMLLDEIDESSPLKGDVVKIMEGGQRSAAIVQDLLTLARRGVQTRKVFNLNAAITDCRKTPEFEKILSFNPKVRIKTELEADLLNITGSPVHLAKTIMNLVANAVEAMPEGGMLTITTSNQSLEQPVHGYDTVNEGDYVVLSVTDTGEGISKSDIKHIFEPFYTKKIMGRSGTGLGLSVVWGTVKDHDGYIDVQSEVEKGTTFTLYFPVTREEIPQEAAIPLSAYIGKDESILVIDDIKEQRELAAKMLGKLNYKVKTVDSGEAAIEYLRTKKADLIILDMIMDPGMDGLDTYKAILEIHPKQKAIIVSGFSETERVKEAKTLGAGDYLRKPYVMEKLGLAVRKELDRISEK